MTTPIQDKYKVVHVEDGYEIHDKEINARIVDYTFALYDSAGQECEHLNERYVRDKGLENCETLEEVARWHDTYAIKDKALQRAYEIGYRKALFEGPRLKDLKAGLKGITK